MKKIALIVQRYGNEVNGGSEGYTKMLAEQLISKFDVHVLTTCALEYTTWKNHYPTGEETINGVTVHRFPTNHDRSLNFDELSSTIFEKEHAAKQELEWIDAQGPYSTDFVNYIKENIDTYDLFFPMTYLYWTTFNAIPHIKNKSIFFPTAHDEPPIYLEIFKRNFQDISAIAYLTNEEKSFVQRKFENQNVASDVIGSGVDLATLPENFELSSVLQIPPKKYITYVGRIDESKGCQELIDNFLAYLEYSKSDLSLVFMGKAVMDIPKHPQIVSLGFVSDEVKTAVISNAIALAMPSFFESLSLVTLESMLLSVPVIANGKTEVLKGHCIRSNAGLYYENTNEFIKIVELMEKNPNYLLESMGENGVTYVNENYTWDKVLERLEGLMDKVLQLNK